MTNREMKDSGVEWIGEIPGRWVVGKVQNAFYRKKEKANVVNPTILSLARSGIKVRDISNNEGQLAADYSNYNPVSVGDVLLNPMDLVSGANCNISNIEGVISPAYINLRAKTNYSGKYYNYYFKLQYWSYAFFAHGKGVSYENRWTLNNETIMKYPIPVSTYEEQQKIATFLDEKVAHIDNIIDDTKKSIENLKAYKQSLITETVTKGLNPNVEMKDSGIDWVGKIPKHWMLRKIKHLTSKIGSGKTPRGGGNIYSNEGILFLRSQNIYETGLYLENATYISPEIDDSMKSTRVYSNDVLLNITGGSIGRACVYPQYIETHANVNQHVCILRPIQEYTHPSYLFYYLISHVGRNYIRYYQTGGNREGLNFEQIGNFAIPSFSIHEQTKIVNYLDEKTSQVDQIVNQQKQLVKEFESYKRSIIYEYVTGKKEVK